MVIDILRELGISLLKLHVNMTFADRNTQNFLDKGTDPTPSPSSHPKPIDASGIQVVACLSVRCGNADTVANYYYYYYYYYYYRRTTVNSMLVVCK